MASGDMASACGAEVSELPVVEDIDQERLKSAYNCLVYMGAGLRTEIRMLNMTNSIIQLVIPMTLSRRSLPFYSLQRLIHLFRM